MPSGKVPSFTNLAGGQTPVDEVYVAKSPFGLTDDRFSTLNDLFAEITKNVSDLSIQWANGDGTATVSAINKGKVRYSNIAQSFQVSENGGSYENLIKGVGVNTRVAFWTSPSILSSDSAFLWDEVNDRLLINVSVAGGGAPIDVLADGAAVGQQWRGSGTERMQAQIGGGIAAIGTSSNDDFYLLSNNSLRVVVEKGGAVSVNPSGLAQAQFESNAASTGTTAIIGNNTAATTVDLFKLRISNSNRLRFTKDSELILGLSSIATGVLTFAVAGSANTQTLRGADTPASTLAFKWPAANPTAGQVLTASAPTAGVVTLSYTTQSLLAVADPPTNSVQFNNGSNILQGEEFFKFDPATSTVQIGDATIQGKIEFFNASISNHLTLRVGTVGSETWDFPSTGLPSVNQVLTATAVAGTTVTLGWTTPSGGGTPSAPLNSVQFNNAGSFGGNSNFLYDPTSSPNVLIQGAANTHVALRVSAHSDAVTAHPVVFSNISNNSQITFDPTNSIDNVVTVISSITNDLIGFSIFNSNADSTKQYFDFTQSVTDFFEVAHINSGSAGSSLVNIASSGYLLTGSAAAGGLLLIAAGASAPIRFAVGGSASGNEQMRLSTSGLQLGLPSTNTGKLILALSGSANTQTLQGADTPASTLAFKWPAANPTAGQVLTASAPTAGVVTLSYTTQSLLAVADPPTNSVQFNNGSNILQGEEFFKFDPATSTVQIGDATIQGKIELFNASSSNHLTLRIGTIGSETWDFPSTGLPSVNQVLTATAVAGTTVTLGWTTPSSVSGSGTSPRMAYWNPTNTITDTVGLTWSSTAQAITLAGAAVAGGASLMTLTPGAHSAVVAEVIDYNHAAHTMTITGSFATQRFTVFAQPTISAGSALTVTTAATVAIANAPNTSGTAAITTPLAFWVQAGKSLFAGVITIPDGATGNGNFGVNFTTSGGIYRNSGSNVVISVSGNQDTAVGVGGLWKTQNTGTYGWVSGTDPTLGADTAIARIAAAQIRLTNGSVGSAQLLLGASSDTIGAQLDVRSGNTARIGLRVDSGAGSSVTLVQFNNNSTVTGTIATTITVATNTTGVTTDGFGGQVLYQLKDTVGTGNDASSFATFWTTASHSFRTSAMSWSLVKSAGTLTERMRFTGDTLSLHDGTVPNVWTAGSYLAKIYAIDGTLNPTIQAAFFSNSGGVGGVLSTLRGRGTNAVPTAIQSTDRMGDLEFWGQFSTATNNVVAGARLRANATENWASGANGCNLEFYTSPNASTITLRCVLTQTGTFRINPNGAYSSFTTNNLLQVGSYAAYNNDAIAAIFAQSDANKVLELIGTNAQTGALLRAFNDTVTPDLLTLSATGILSLRAGTSANQGLVGMTMKVNTTSQQNTGTGETDLITYSLPANVLAVNSDYLCIEAWGTTAANTNGKTIRLKFGGTTIFDTGSTIFNGADWLFRATVVRTGATTQITSTLFSSSFIASFAASTTNTTASETLSGAVTIKCTGIGGATGDITQLGLIVRYFHGQ